MESTVDKAGWQGWARLCLRHPHLHSSPVHRRGKPGLQFVAVPCEAAQGPQMKLSFPLLHPTHSSAAPIHIVSSPMGKEYSPLQPLSYSFIRAGPSMQASSPKPTRLPPLRPPSLLSLLRLTLHRHARPAAGLEQTTTGKLVGKWQGKCSSLAGKQQGKALNPNPRVAGDCPSSAKDLGPPRYPLPLGQQTRMGLQQGGSHCRNLSRAAQTALSSTKIPHCP